MRSHLVKVLIPALSMTMLSGCAGFDTSVGPGKGHIAKIAREGAVQGVRVVEVTDQVARQIQAQEVRPSFANDFPQAQPTGQWIGKGDVLSVLIWEAPPAALFGGSSLGSTTSIGAANTTTLPEIQVGPTGDITVPYAGRVHVEGRTLSEIEREIVRRLSGKAHMPQVAVRLAQNASSQITVVGEVVNNTQVPLTPKGERLLDAIARAGGPRQPVDKVMIQLTRDNRVESMPLSDIIANPRENVVMQAGDVVTALFQPFSFTALGAAGRNQEVNFEARGITLSQALGRIAGLEDRRADPQGVFLFRWADPRSVPGGVMNAGQDPQGRVPVIYRIDMKNPSTYFAMQSFMMKDKDVLYVSNSPVAEFQRFFGIIASTVLPVLAVNRAL